MFPPYADLDTLRCLFCGADEAPLRGSGDIATCEACTRTACEVLRVAIEEGELETPAEGAGASDEDGPMCTECGRSQRAVRKLVAGKHGYLCDGCIVGHASAWGLALMPKSQ